ncbi:MAG: hypothetical protein FWH26_06355 [Oscillospiraceae bacterium]|nr:hypothetical protein [Oscillospiraceae bacterium]
MKKMLSGLLAVLMLLGGLSVSAGADPVTDVLEQMKNITKYHIILCRNAMRESNIYFTYSIEDWWGPYGEARTVVSSFGSAAAGTDRTAYNNCRDELDGLRNEFQLYAGTLLENEFYGLTPSEYTIFLATADAFQQIAYLAANHKPALSENYFNALTSLCEEHEGKAEASISTLLASVSNGEEFIEQFRAQQKLFGIEAAKDYFSRPSHRIFSTNGVSTISHNISSATLYTSNILTEYTAYVADHLWPLNPAAVSQFNKLVNIDKNYALADETMETAISESIVYLDNLYEILCGELVLDPSPYTFTLTVVGGTGSGPYLAGSTVNIAANPATDGKVFDKWEASAGTIANPTSANTTFTMPTSNATVTATYKNASTEDETEDPKYFWSDWGSFMQFVLKWFLFGWIWMRWVQPI